MTFNAIALSDKFENGRCSGRLETNPGGLVFTNSLTQEQFKMPLRDVQMRIGGAGNRFVFFSHDKVPGITFYTDDRAILNSDEIRFDPELKKVVAKLKNKGRLVWGILGSLLGLIVLGIVALFVFRGAIIERIANLVPPSKEQEISESMRTSAIAGKKIIKDSAIMHQLDAITSPLISALNDTNFSFSFTIIEDSTLNAFALPGGAIVIHSGLIEKAKSAEEVAGVLAHEISHVTRRHHIRGIIGNLGIFLVIRGILGDMAGVSADIANAGATLSSLKYSRDFEHEADDNGFMLLQKAHINTSGMISFFETLDKQSSVELPSDFMSTHPSTDKRIERLKKKQKNSKEYSSIAIDFKGFQNSINTYFKNKQ